MNGRNFMFAGLALALILFCVVAGIGMSVYNMGVVQGMAGGGRYAPAPAPVAPAPNTAPYPYPYYGGGWHPFGGFLSCLGPLFALLLVLFLVRCIFRPWRWHRHGRMWGGGVPPMFDEWHRQAHQQNQPPQQPSGGPTPGPSPER